MTNVHDSMRSPVSGARPKKRTGVLTQLTRENTDGFDFGIVACLSPEMAGTMHHEPKEKHCASNETTSRELAPKGCCAAGGRINALRLLFSSVRHRRTITCKQTGGGVDCRVSLPVKVRT